MKKLLLVILMSTFSYGAIAADKSNPTSDNKKEWNFKGSTLYGEGYGSSRSIIKEFKADKFDYIFSQQSNYLNRINELSRFTGRD